MNARKPRFKISIAGKNVTDDLTKYVSDIAYTDRTKGQSDEVSITLNNSDGRFVADWMPETNDKLDVSIGFDDDLIDCGTFTIDTVEAQGPPSTVTIKALAAGTNSPLRTIRTVPHDGKTIKEIAQSIADTHGFTLNDGTQWTTVEKADWKKEREALTTAAAKLDAAIANAKQITEPAFFNATVRTAFEQYPIMIATTESLVAKGQAKAGTGLRQIIDTWAAAWRSRYFPTIKQAVIHGQNLSNQLKNVSASLIDIDRTTTRSKLDIKTSWESQDNETDLAYLERLAKKYGILFSVRGTVMTFTSIYDVEAAPSIDAIYSKEVAPGWRFSKSKVSQVTAAEVVWHNPETGEEVKSRFIEAAPPPSTGPGIYQTFLVDPNYGTGEILKIQERVETQAQADQVAKAAIHSRASKQFEGEITIEGRRIFAGCNVDLIESDGIVIFGNFAGKWAVTESAHRLDVSGGWVVSLKIKRGR